MPSCCPHCNICHMSTAQHGLQAPQLQLLCHTHLCLPAVHEQTIAAPHDPAPLESSVQCCSHCRPKICARFEPQPSSLTRHSQKGELKLPTRLLCGGHVGSPPTTHECPAVCTNRVVIHGTMLGRVSPGHATTAWEQPQPMQTANQQHAKLPCIGHDKFMRPLSATLTLFLRSLNPSVHQHKVMSTLLCTPQGLTAHKLF